MENDVILKDLAKAINDLVANLQKELTVVFHKSVQLAAHYTLNSHKIKNRVGNFLSNLVPKMQEENHITLEQYSYLKEQVNEISNMIFQEALNVVPNYQPSSPAPQSKTPPRPTQQPLAEPQELTSRDLAVLNPLFDKFKAHLLMTVKDYFNKVKAVSSATAIKPQEVKVQPAVVTAEKPIGKPSKEIMDAINKLPEYAQKKAEDAINGSLIKIGENKGKIKFDSNIIEECIELMNKLGLNPEDVNDIKKLWPNYKGENLMKDQKEQLKRDEEELLGPSTKRQEPMESKDHRVAKKILQGQSTSVIKEYYKNLIKYGI